MKGPHEYGPVDDCTRCIYCEILPGKDNGPCYGNDISVVPSTTPGPWVPFGTNYDLPDWLALEFSEVDEDSGLPTSERVISP
jgi:hypothetical protein